MVLFTDLKLLGTGMKGISIWWRGSGSVPWRGGDQMAPAPPPVRPRAGVFNLSPLADLRVFIYFSSSRGGADSCRANAGSLAGGSLLPVPFYGPSSPRSSQPPRGPRCGLGPAGSAGCFAPGKTLRRLTPGCPVHELGCQIDILAKMKHGEAQFVATQDARALSSCIARGRALAVPRSRVLGCLFKELLPLLSWNSKSLEHQQPDLG